MKRIALLVYDDEHFCMGSCLSELLCKRGLEVILVTPAPVVSSWTSFTDEQEQVQAGLIKLGVKIVTGMRLAAIDHSEVELGCVYTDRREYLPCASVIAVTAREPRAELYHELTDGRQPDFKSLTRIGDCYVPGAIVDAVYAGHRYARELDGPMTEELGFHRERATRAGGNNN